VREALRTAKMERRAEPNQNGPLRDDIPNRSLSNFAAVSGKKIAS
jgi:hypothetical protein